MKLTESARRGLFGRDPAAFPTISEAGFQIGRVAPEPMLVSLVWNPSSRDYIRRNPPRMWHLQNPQARILLGIGVAYQYKDVMADLRTELVGVDSFKACRDAMVKAVRMIAARDSRVGNDVIAVEVSREPVGTVGVFFEASDPSAEVTVALGSKVVLVKDPWYSPWIIGRRVSASPAIHAGAGYTVSGGELKVILASTGPDVLQDGTVMLIAPQMRRPRPMR